MLALYLYLFVPREKRETGAKLLIWIWAPAVIAGAMTAVHERRRLRERSAVGLAPALIVSGLFLAWALEAAGAGRRSRGWRWSALIAIVGVTLGFSFQYQQRDVPLRLSSPVVLTRGPGGGSR